MYILVADRICVLEAHKALGSDGFESRDPGPR